MTAHDARFTPRPSHIALVGAGPGTADLLTLRAVDRLRQAEVISRDRPVAPGVLAHRASLHAGQTMHHQSPG